MVTTRGAQSEGRAQETAQSNAPIHQADDNSSSSDDDIPAEPIPNYKRSRTILFTGPTLRPTKRLRNSREYIPPSKRLKRPQVQEQSVEAKGIQQNDDIDEDEDALLHKQIFDMMNSFTQSRNTSLPPAEPQPEPQPSATPVKHGRGRPRKHPLPAMAQNRPAPGKQLSERALEQIETLAQETLEPVEATQEKDKMLDSVEDVYHTAYEAVQLAEDQESQLLKDLDDNVNDERQQEEIIVQEEVEQEEEVDQEEEVEQKEDAGQKENATQEEDAAQGEDVEQEGDTEQEPDSESDEELPSLSNWAKRTEKQVPSSGQPELRPEHTRPSPVLGRDPADEFVNGDDDLYEVQTDSEDEANNQPHRAPSNRFASPFEDLLLFRAPGSVDESYQVDIPSNTIMPLPNVMGNPGWTGLGKDWAEIIVQPYQAETRKPITTQVVRYFCKELHEIKVLLDQAPPGTFLPKQNTYLRGVQERMIKSPKVIQDIVSMCEQHLTPNGVIEPRYRQSLRQDLFLYGIPILVLVLSSAYHLGKVNGGYLFDFPQSATFTRSRVQYLDLITGWIKRLGTKLVPEVPHDEDEHLGYVGRFQTKVLERKVKENRLHFMKVLACWEETLQEALSDIDDVATQQAEDIARKIARDQAIKKERQAAQEAERAKKEAQYRAFVLSTQRPGSQLLSRVQQAQSVTPRSTPIPRSSGVIPTIELAPARHQQQQPPRSLYKLWYPRWPEEKRRWLLKELRRVGPRVSNMEYEDWADCLRKPIEEVRHEVKIHRAAALIVASRRGKPVEWWARGVDE